MYRCLIILSFLIGCASRTTITKDLAGDRAEVLKPIDSLLFPSPVINFCIQRDGNVLLLDAGQEKIFKVNLNKPTFIETIILPQKIYFLKGIATDNFFIYLYSENSVYRFDCTTQKLSTIIDPKDKIKIFDLTVTLEGEIFITDDLNNQILLVNSLSKVLKFNTTMKDLFIPAGISYDNQTSDLLVINKAQSRIEIYSRIGNIDSIIKLPVQSCSKITLDQDKILVWQNNSKNIYYLIKGKMNWYQIVTNQLITNIALYNNLLLLLDSSKGIFVYQID